MATGKLTLQTGCLCLLLGYLAAASLTLLQQMPLIVQGCCADDRFTGCGEGRVEEREEKAKSNSLPTEHSKHRLQGLLHGSSSD